MPKRLSSFLDDAWLLGSDYLPRFLLVFGLFGLITGGGSRILWKPEGALLLTISAILGLGLGLLLIAGLAAMQIIKEYRTPGGFIRRRTSITAWQRIVALGAFALCHGLGYLALHLWL